MDNLWKGMSILGIWPSVAYMAVAMSDPMLGFLAAVCACAATIVIAQC